MPNRISSAAYKRELCLTFSWGILPQRKKAPSKRIVPRVVPMAICHGKRLFCGPVIDNTMIRPNRITSSTYISVNIDRHILFVIFSILSSWILNLMLLASKSLDLRIIFLPAVVPLVGPVLIGIRPELLIDPLHDPGVFVHVQIAEPAVHNHHIGELVRILFPVSQ